MLEFIASMTSALAWPLLLLGFVVALREPLQSLARSVTRISHGDTAIDFDRQAKEVTASLVASGEVGSDKLQSLVPVTAPNVGKIVVAWSELEDLLRQRLAEKGVQDAGRFQGMHLLQSAMQNDLISMEQAESLRGLRIMRNLAVHGQSEQINNARADEFVALADAVKMLLSPATLDRAVAERTAAAIAGQSELATMSYAALRTKLEADYPILRK